MVLVRGHDALSAVEVGEETSAWGTAASGTMYRVPILNESLALEREQFPKAREFGSTGSVEFLEPGRSVVRGAVTVHPRYDAAWFHILLAHSFGSEVVIPNEWVNGIAAGTVDANTHGYTFAAALPMGLTFKVWKSGPTTAGYIDTFTGCIITRVVWEQPEDDIARVTFEFVGKTVTTNIASGSPAAAAGSVFLKARDLSRATSRVKTGSTLANNFSLRSLRLTWDRRIEEESAFLNDPDTLAKPGVIDTRDVTIELNGQLEQTYGAANTPWTEFLAKTTSQCDIRYCAVEVVQGTNPYSIRFHMPALIWEEVNNNLGEPGSNPFVARGRAIQGTVATQAGTDESGSTVLATGPITDLRCFAAVQDGDDSDNEFSVL